MVYGYARISTAKQSLQRQVDNLRAFDPDITLYTETWSGRVSERPAYQRLKRRAGEGDTVVFDSVSRMSRDATSGVKDYFAFMERGVSLVFLKERHIDTEVFRQAAKRAVTLGAETGDAATDRFMGSLTEAVNTLLHDVAVRQIELAFEQSEKEVSDLRQRTREGLRVAKAQGRRVGNVEGSTRTTKKKREAVPVIRRHCKRYGGTLTNDETMRLAGIGRSAFYRYCREIDEEIYQRVLKEEEEA